MAKFRVSDAFKKTAKTALYLTLSNGIGYLLATYVAKDPVLTAVFGPTINLIAYQIEKELKQEGYIKALRG